MVRLVRTSGRTSYDQAYLVVGLVDTLDEACDGGLQQHQQGEAPGEAEHEAHRPQRVDQGPQQHVDVQRHRAPHRGGVL